MTASTFLRTLDSALRSYRGCLRGVTAIEFALTAPILVLILLGVVDLGKIVYDRTDMHTALRGGAQYFMAGGADFEEARSLVEQSWSSGPDTSAVDIVTYCLCGDANAVCGQLCPDDSVPDVYRELTATALLQGTFGRYEISANETVRTR